MKRAYELIEQNVKNMVPAGMPGTYMLGEIQDNSFQVLYVGRSDTCLKTRLMQHLKSGVFHFFRFRMCRGRATAFRHECSMYHIRRTKYNKIHPAHNGQTECPICGPAHDMQIMLSNHN